MLLFAGFSLSEHHAGGADAATRPVDSTSNGRRKSLCL